MVMSISSWVSYASNLLSVSNLCVSFNSQNSLYSFSLLSVKMVLISHRYRFIFLKTRKTAGTSVEAALQLLVESKGVGGVEGVGVASGVLEGAVGAV